MARKGKGDGPNLSESIRAYLKDHRGAKANTIMEDLAKEGIHVSRSLISAVKYKKRGKNGRKPGRPAAAENGRPKAAASEKVTIESLMAAKQMVAKLGSVEAAVRAMDVYSKLQS